MQSSLHLLTDADAEMQQLLEYPFTKTLASEEVSEVLQDDFPQVSSHLSALHSAQTAPYEGLPWHVQTGAVISRGHDAGGGGNCGCP